MSNFVSPVLHLSGILDSYIQMSIDSKLIIQNRILGKANQNYSDISLHTRQDGYYKKQKQKQEVTRIG